MITTDGDNGSAKANQITKLRISNHTDGSVLSFASFSSQSVSLCCVNIFTFNYRRKNFVTHALVHKSSDY